MRDAVENFALRSGGGMTGDYRSSFRNRPRTNFNGAKTCASLGKLHAFLGRRFPVGLTVILIDARHVHHGAVVFSIAAAASGKVRFRIGEESGQSRIACEYQQQRGCDNSRHGFDQYTPWPGLSRTYR